MKKNDLVGLVFNRLTVIKDGGRDRKMNVLWLCGCICGETALARAYELTSGKVKSCGCWARDAHPVKHGQARAGHNRSRTYSIWAAMVQRCTNPNDRSWGGYGGRGIKVVDGWLKFESFLSDLGECPTGYSIERIDVNGDYTPANCKWIPRNEQSRNTRSNVNVTLFGKTAILADWVKEIGTSRAAVHYWLKKGMTHVEALERIARKRSGQEVP